MMKSSVNSAASTSTTISKDVQPAKQHKASHSVPVEPMDLNENAFQHILSFLKPKPVDLLPLAETCKSWLAHIESHCNNSVADTIRNHPVDNAFLQRVNNCFKNRNKAIPHRCLWWAAHRVHLYEKQMPCEYPMHMQRCIELASPNGKYRVVVLCSCPSRIIIWDLQENSCHTMVNLDEHIWTESCFWMDNGNKVFVAARDRFLVLDVIQKGKSEIVIESVSQNTLSGSWVKKDERTMIYRRMSQKTVFSLDIITHFQQELGQTQYRVRTLAISPNGRWILVQGYEWRGNDDGPKYSILDLGNQCRVACELEVGSYDPIFSHRVPKVFFGFRGLQKRMWDEANGKLLDNANFCELYPSHQDGLFDIVEVDEKELRLKDLDTASFNRVLKFPTGKTFDNLKHGNFHADVDRGMSVQPAEKEIWVNLRPTRAPYPFGWEMDSDGERRFNYHGVYVAAYLL